MKTEKPTPKPVRTTRNTRPTADKRGEGQCSPTPTTDQPGGRRGQACPEGYPEVQPTDVPDDTTAQQAKSKTSKHGKATND